MASFPKLKSIQIGGVVTSGDPNSNDLNERQWTSAFGKQPVSGSVEITTASIVGDHYANPINHGGVDKVILCYAESNYEQWRTESPAIDWSPGAMGENFLVTGQDETNVCIGDVYSVGERCVVQVSQPRGPCWKINRFHRDQSLLKSVVRSGRTGWYLRVLVGGRVRAGDKLILREYYHPEWPISRCNDVAFGREKDLRLRSELLRLEWLAAAWKDSLGG